MVTNVQLTLTIGIPSVLVILSWASTNRRLSALVKRYDDLIAAQDRLALQIMRSMSALNLALFQSNRAR